MVDEAALAQDEIELVLQVNGKLRGDAQACRPRPIAPRSRPAALASPEFERFGEGRAIKRVIVVPGRLVNVVV